MQLDSPKPDNKVSFAFGKSKPKSQNENPLNKSPRRQKDFQKVDSKPDQQSSPVKPIKLTITLKDIGMSGFDPTDHENHPKENERLNTPRPNQAHPIQSESELPRLNHFNKYSNQNQTNPNPPSPTENKLPKLIRNNTPNIFIQTDQNQFNPNLKTRSPRRNKSNYDPSIFYSPPKDLDVNQCKPLLVRNDKVKFF